MKRCTYCGAEYADDAVDCLIDHRPLESSRPTPALPAVKPEISEEIPPPSSPEAGTIPKAEYFRCLWRIDASDADWLLQQFAKAGIRFKIDQTVALQRIEMFLGYPPTPKINIYVHSDDKEKAMHVARLCFGFCRPCWGGIRGN